MTWSTAILFVLIPLVAAAVVQFYRPVRNYLKTLLSFSGAFLLSIALIHMLPELFHHGEHDHSGAESLGVWILTGFIVQVLLEFFSKGLEHGHMHFDPNKTFPFMVFFSLWIHAFVEGMPFADHAVAADRPFVIGVLLHKLPVAIALATVLLQGQLSRGLSWLLISLFALSTPMGMFAGIQLSASFGEELLPKALALAIGSLLHISTTIIFESSTDHRFNRSRFMAVVVGVVLAVLSLQVSHM